MNQYRQSHIHWATIPKARSALRLNASWVARLGNMAGRTPDIDFGKRLIGEMPERVLNLQQGAEWQGATSTVEACPS